MKEENVMKKTIKSALSKGVSAMLNRTVNLVTTLHHANCRY